MAKKTKTTSVHSTPEAAPYLTAAGYLSPTQLVGLTALAIFVAEAVIMFLMPLLGPIPVVYEAIVDAVLLTVLAAPFLYFLLFRPMVLHINERKTAESALLHVNANLEHRVKERTQELTRSNKALNQEIQERRATEARIQRTNDFVQRLIESAPCLMATVDASSLRCNYVNGRIEDFLGHSPDDMARSGGTLFDSIIAPDSKELYTTMIRRVTEAPQGEIARDRCLFKNADGGEEPFRVGVVVVSRTAIGEAEEVLIVATPVDDCS
jgi:PAS domain S-box-containing protein